MRSRRGKSVVDYQNQGFCVRVHIGEYTIDGAASTHAPTHVYPLPSLAVGRPRYLRLVDRFNEQNVSAFLTAGGAKLMLLHDGRTDEAIRSFFTEVHEIYVKARLRERFDEVDLRSCFERVR